MIKRLVRFLVVIIILLSGFSLSAQDRGQILSGSNPVLDPNGDGYITNTGATFSADGYDVDEFEIPMFGIPIVGEGDLTPDDRAHRRRNRISSRPLLRRARPGRRTYPAVC